MSKRAEQAALKAYPRSDFQSVETSRKTKRKCYITGYEQAEKDTIEKAIEWLKANAYKYSLWDIDECCLDYDDTECINDFRKAMEEEQ